MTAPTLTNDMRGAFLARCLGARTIAFGTHVTPMPLETMEAFPTLDFVLRGEPELTLRELIDTLEEGRVDSGRAERRSGGMQSGAAPAQDVRRASDWQTLFRDADPDWQPAWQAQPGAATRRHQRPRLARTGRTTGSCQIRVNPDRPFIRDLDDLPLPLHHLLPWDQYRAPKIRGPYTFIVTSRGCPAGCTFCIKHVSYGYSVRVRSPENMLAELELLLGPGHAQRPHVRRPVHRQPRAGDGHLRGHGPPGPGFQVDLQQPRGFCGPRDAGS